VIERATTHANTETQEARDRYERVQLSDRFETIDARHARPRRPDGVEQPRGRADVAGHVAAPAAPAVQQPARLE
jgi:hypothetical protein